MVVITDTSREGLPVQLTTFIGRAQEISALRALIAASRLLTITGGGGSGKTRLALEVGQLAGADLDLPVACAELAPLQESSHLAQRVADACGIGEEIRGGDPALLVGLLRGRRLLLLLDNCEHLVDACAVLVDELLRGCPDIRILATSREALGVSGERAWLVPALPNDEAVQLFVERARDFSGQFEITEKNRAIVQEICTRLDGIPLAIELAAARIRVLTPEQLRDRLHDAFRLLKSPARVPIPRHRTLAAAIDWSYDLLSADERSLFQRISVFHGGFTLDALEAVGADGMGDPLELLARLVDRSLVTVREQDGHARYTLLETVRQYARQKLEETDGEHAVRLRHAQYILQIVMEAEPHFIMRDRPLWIERLLPDLENIREALNFTRTADAQLHVRLAGSLWWFWYSTRHWTEAGVILDQALALPEAAGRTRERGKLLFARGALASLQAKPQEARTYLEEAVRIGRACDEQLLAYSQNYLGMNYAGEGRPEGTELCKQAAAWFAQNNDPYGERLSYLLLGTTAANAGDLVEGERWLRMGVAIAREFGQPRELSIAVYMLAWVFAERGDYATARELTLESLAASRQDPSYFSIATALDLLADITGQERDPLRAARLFGAAEQVRAVIGARRFPYVEKRYAQTTPRIRAQAGAAAFDHAWAEGKRLSVDEILEEVLTARSPEAPAPDVPSPQPRAVALHVCALGRFEVAVNAETLSDELWAYGKPKELLVYLLLHAQGAARDRIARALWPAATPSQLKNSFHVTLHHLRKALGHPEWIVVEEERYRIARDVEYEFDADIFESRAEQALRTQDALALEQALTLYRGHLLEDAVTGDWLEDHLARLQRLYFEVALTLGRAWEAAGNAQAASQLYQQLIARDDLQEEAHRRLLAHWTRAGDRARALKHYERLAATLRETLAAEPEQETVQLYQQILAGQPI